jgi:hypothetical protein
MIGLLPILARWKWGLGLAGVLALAGLVLALQHYRSAYYAEKVLRQAQEAAYANAQIIAADRAQAALRQQEHIYVTKARGIEHEYVAKMADARSAADAYISRMRVKTPSRDASGTITSASGGNPGVPADMPAAAVMVSEGDVRACTDASAYAIAAHDWALGLKTGP